MRQLSLLRSTPFRLALTFAVLFIIAFILSGAVVYQLMRANLADRLDQSAKETFTVVAATYAGADLEDLIATVNSHARLASAKDQLFSLTDANGAQLAGNFLAKGVSAGFSVIEEGALGVPSGNAYRAYSGKVGPFDLAIALALSETRDLERIVLIGFGWATLLVAILALGGGALLALRVQRRLDAIAATMGDVSQGKLAARIPLIGNGDDIDGVSAQINLALDQLSALIEGMRQVSSDIAHDLKTPLNRLQLILEDARQKAAAGKNTVRELLDAQAESGQINETFDALLRIAQIEAGARKARFTIINLEEVIETIAEIYTGVAEDSDMSLLLRKTLQGPARRIHGDAELLTQMFANLVENALRHCPSGTSVELTLMQHRDTVVATVADDGPGIPQAEHGKVFRRLYRLDKSRSTLGSGLGLSLVHAIAELHGAKIVLKDMSPGLAVIISFPTVHEV
ncbi:ATP-binding protein [Labrys sp. La1]|uniref:sensor histidine kinase n=1 Tax=Labrys sp. La1 TaxID=3404917 RepID=UPI003EBD953F